MALIPPAIDLSALPRHLEGKWVFVRVDQGHQEIIAAADTPVDLPGGGLHTGDPTLVLTQVPSEHPISIVELAL